MFINSCIALFIDGVYLAFINTPDIEHVISRIFLWFRPLVKQKLAKQGVRFFFFAVVIDRIMMILEMIIRYLYLYL